MDSEIIVAADLGNFKIAVMAAKKFTDGKLEILGMDSVETPLDSIRNGILIKPSEVAASLSYMLKLLSNRIKLPIHQFYIGLNGRSLRTVSVSDPIFGNDEEITADTLGSIDEAVKRTDIRDRELLRVLQDGFFLDNEPIQNPVGVFGGNLKANYVLAIAKPELSLALGKCLDRVAGYSVAEEILLAPMATATALLSESEKMLGSAVVDLGAGCTSVTIYKDGLMKHMAVIPLGGKHITNDLKSLNLLDAEAERIKVMYGEKFSLRDKKVLKIDLPAHAEGLGQRSVSTRDAELIINARLNEILDLVMAQIEKSGYADKLGAGLVVTGGVTNMKYIDEVVKEKTGIDARVGSFLSNLTENSNQEFLKPEYAQLVGLLLCGKLDCTQSLKDAPKEQSKKPPRRTIKDRINDLFSDDAQMKDNLNR